MDNNKFGVSSDDLVDEAPINQNFIISEKLAKADDKDPTQYIGDWHILGQAKNLSMDRPIAIKAAKKLNGKVFAVLGEWKKYLDLINLEAYNTGAHNIVEYVSQAIEVANEFLWMDVYAHIIEGLYLDTSEGAYASVGVDFQGALVDQVNERAVEYARTRGAELISIDGDPSIIESTRNMIGRTIADGLENNIGRDGIIESLQDSYAFSEERATVIADNEIAEANSFAKLEAWNDVIAGGATLVKQWFTSEDEGVCPICGGNEEQGEIDFAEEFSSGDEMEPAHVNCRCVTVARVMVDGEDSSE